MSPADAVLLKTLSSASAWKLHIGTCMVILAGGAERSALGDGELFQMFPAAGASVVLIGKCLQCSGPLMDFIKNIFS